MAQGYLAAIYRSIPTKVGGVDRHQLLVNPTFDTGNTNGWTTSGTVTVETGGRGAGSAWVAKIVDTGSGAGLEQTVTLDTALTSAAQCYARCWAYFSPGKTGKLKITFLDEEEMPIGSPVEVTMSATPRFPVKGWGLWSVRMLAPVGTKAIRYEAKTTSPQTWFLDDCGLMLIRQILGATGTLESAVLIDTTDVTTFASAQSDGGWRRFYPTLYRGEQMTVRTLWSTDDTYSVTAEEEVFVILYHDTAAQVRDEFYARVTGQVGRFPLEGVVERDLILTIISDVGTTDSTAD